MHSIEIVEQEVVSLQERMSLVKEDIETVEAETATTMRVCTVKVLAHIEMKETIHLPSPALYIFTHAKVLVELDQLRERMAATSSALQEADNWTTLTSEIEDAFDKGELSRIASLLLNMRRSLLVLSDVPDYDARETRLVELKDQFEALLGPRLIEAIETRDLGTPCDVLQQDRTNHCFSGRTASPTVLLIVRHAHLRICSTLPRRCQGDHHAIQRHGKKRHCSGISPSLRTRTYGRASRRSLT